MKGIQGTSNITFRKLMGNGLRYEIPKFQRDYTWEAEHWDDLWQDIKMLLINEESGHYMGYLVLQTSNNKNFIVIDGQQRLAAVFDFVDDKYPLAPAYARAYHGRLFSDLSPNHQDGIRNYSFICAGSLRSPVQQHSAGASAAGAIAGRTGVVRLPCGKPVSTGGIGEPGRCSRFSRRAGTARTD